MHYWELFEVSLQSCYISDLPPSTAMFIFYISDKTLKLTFSTTIEYQDLDLDRGRSKQGHDQESRLLSLVWFHTKPIEMIL